MRGRMPRQPRSRAGLPVSQCSNSCLFYFVFPPNRLDWPTSAEISQEAKQKQAAHCARSNE
jgi:hypothetical protein